MENKKSIMVFSALQILIFHLWIYIGTSDIEQFIKQTAYVGVDIFFLLSAYSLAKYNKPVKYFKFVWSRFKSVYLKFIIFAIVAFFYSSWSITRLINVVISKELFVKGGGSFLWFLPTIMIFYLIYPLFKKCDNKNRIVTIISTIILWLVGSYFLTNSDNLKVLMIAWNRLPVFFIGYYLYFIEPIKTKKWLKLLVGISLTIIGSWLVYKYAFRIRLQVPFRDMFYLTLIPVAIGLTLLVSFIPECKLTKIIGSCTLEMYAIQMIFGYKFENQLFQYNKNMLIINLITIVYVIILSVLIHYSLSYLIKCCKYLYTKMSK